MQQPSETLDDLRREIDRIDDAIQDLIMQRTAIVARVGAAKQAAGPAGQRGAFLRPGREAMLLRRIVARHRGRFPKPALVRLWRELISAPLSIQGPFSVAVYAPKSAPGYWDLARDQYGSHTSFTAHRAASQVLRAVGGGSATLGVLPVIEDDEPDPWWPAIAREDARGVWVVARLPMAGQGNARGEAIQALVVGRAPPEPTGRDNSLLAFTTARDTSRARIIELLAKGGLSPRHVGMWEPPGEEVRLFLVELEGHVLDNDARIAAFRAELGEPCRGFYLGGYALPLTPEELAERA